MEPGRSRTKGSWERGEITGERKTAVESRDLTTEAPVCSPLLWTWWEKDRTDRMLSRRPTTPFATALRRREVLRTTFPVLRAESKPAGHSSSSSQGNRSLSEHRPHPLPRLTRRLEAQWLRPPSAGQWLRRAPVSMLPSRC